MNWGILQFYLLFIYLPTDEDEEEEERKKKAANTSIMFPMYQALC